jgi:hypothetical protein
LSSRTSSPGDGIGNQLNLFFPELAARLLDSLPILSTRCLMLRAFSIAAWLACAGTCSSMAAGQAPVYGYDLRGQPITHLAAPPAGAVKLPVVLFFLATDCPVSNSYVPEIQRIEQRFAATRATFWLVYPNATETPEMIRLHLQAYGLTRSGSEQRVLWRPQPRLMSIARAAITPESAVLVPSQISTLDANTETMNAVYLGRIDDRYVDIGRERPKATRHDLEQAIEATLKHQPVASPGGPPVGCAIVTEEVLRPAGGKP